MEGRRTGKTSVAVAALDRIRGQGGRVAAVTLTRFADPTEAARVVARQLDSPPRRASESLVTFLRALDRRPVAEVLGGGAASDLGLAADVVDAGVQAPRDLAHVLGSARGRTPGAVLLDEAHVMVGWPASLVDSLNAVLRDRLGVGVLIASSDADALERLTQRGGPLHLAGSRITLPPITIANWMGALRDGFARLEIEIGERTITEMIDLTAGHPYLTMRLARDCARIATDTFPWKVGGAELEAALYELRRDPVWRTLHGDTQR